MASVPPVSPNTSKSAPNGTSDERMWAMLAHFSPLIGIGLIGPLLIWIFKKEESPYVEEHAREALNFSLTLMLAALASLITCVGPVIVAVAGIVYAILAGVEANRGNHYEYPFNIRFIKGPTGE